IGVHADAVRTARIGRDGPDRKATDDAGALVIEERQHFGVALGDQERATPQLGLAVLEPLDELGHETRRVYRSRPACQRGLCPSKDVRWSPGARRVLVRLLVPVRVPGLASRRGDLRRGPRSAGAVADAPRR